MAKNFFSRKIFIRLRAVAHKNNKATAAAAAERERNRQKQAALKVIMEQLSVNISQSMAYHISLPIIVLYCLSKSTTFFSRSHSHRPYCLRHTLNSSTASKLRLFLQQSHCIYWILQERESKTKGVKLALLTHPWW